jgi:hypothetical protein
VPAACEGLVNAGDNGGGIGGGIGGAHGLVWFVGWSCLLATGAT